jgi:hypothetical protein
MAITNYPATPAGQAQAFAVPDPKNISFDGVQFVVKTGPDYVPPPPLTQNQLDVQAALSIPQLKAFMGMTPAQVQDWVANNVSNISQARTAISHLAVAVSILARTMTMIE